MTRDELLARRAHLLPIYQNPNPAHDLQHIEVETELDYIRDRLAELPRTQAQPAPKPRAWKRDGRRLATGDR